MSLASHVPLLLLRLAILVVATLLAAAAADTADARQAKDGKGEVRVAGRCGAGATSKLKLKADDGRIEVEFEVEQNRSGRLWRVALVHERRVVWKGRARTTGSSGSFEVRRLVQDLPGVDVVAARAWGPGGLTCRASASLAGP
ncbi:MAG: hypothetical protein OEW52_06935 [Thermoleophilia bacterium]|nr:hypothetical protein [Thermoleophilia bacterium]MDH4340942.1 hypothetical protein [Thermoleophilia bacterium]MDH5280872.1 hypothetical protein [Thermoleophilia bacterium]